ncbi:MAG: ATP-dependent DNA helicase RecG, partial [Rhodobacterales bacterium]|nr:ATP-dependent DNA helicase RecG [Rhodobacterales bacterium]
MTRPATGRPELLWPLFGDLASLDGIGPKTRALLEPAGITRPRDMLFTLPVSGIDRSYRPTIRGVPAGEVATVEVEVGLHQPSRAKGKPYRVTVQDAETAFQLVFFHARGDYLTKLLPSGQRRIVSGKVEIFDGIAQIVHPDHVLPLGEAATIPAFEPVYP